MRRFIRRKVVLERVPYSKASLYRLIKQGLFPRPYAMDESGRSVAWLEEEVEGWIESRIAARGAGAAQESRTAA